MSDADLKANIAVSTDVEQATQRTGRGIVSLQKQIEDIQKKFSTFGKDLFLGYFAPMAIFQTALGFIQDQLNDAKQRAQEGYDLLARGDTLYATSEQKRRASYVQYRIAQMEEEKKVKEGAQLVYENFLNMKEGQAIYQKHLGQFSGPEGEAGMTTIPRMAASAQVRKDIEDWFAAHPEAIRQQEAKATSYQAPQGVNAVVGMGNNAALQAQLDQLEEQRKQTMLLETIAQSAGNTPPDFTKPATSGAPSRSYLLSK